MYFSRSLKSSRNKKDLMTSQLPHFWCAFLLLAAVTSLRSFLFCDNFILFIFTCLSLTTDNLSYSNSNSIISWGFSSLIQLVNSLKTFSIGKATFKVTFLSIEMLKPLLYHNSFVQRFILVDQLYLYLM